MAFSFQKMNDVYYLGPVQQKKDHISACIAAAQQTKDMIQQLPKLYDIQMVSVLIYTVSRGGSRNFRI